MCVLLGRAGRAPRSAIRDQLTRQGARRGQAFVLFWRLPETPSNIDRNRMARFFNVIAVSGGSLRMVSQIHLRFWHTASTVSRDPRAGGSDDGGEIYHAGLGAVLGHVRAVPSPHV